MTAAVSDFVERLAAVPTVPGRNNFFDHSVPGNAVRRRNLELYFGELLDRSPKVLLLGEAPGFRGMGITGVPFTNRTMFQGPANSTHVPGKPQSNRTPTAADARLGAPYWQSLAELFGIESVVAVGNVAHRSLQRSGLDVPKVRHPSHGGRNGFKRGLGELLDAGVIRS
ncbi:Uracil DNA glycosylase superfamily protein [Arthrobacter sp. 9AX]|uniref:uracil-DNA glycosylase family protein n=1 Tax=Arthrobacter sp. 9AX TaxID=2653131 RepID=UPI0012F03CD1|nr:uracil-DNA glycosylase family protein [Arthrobacter sp. 9AX]VXC06149.1 Uracil DNA glycosylase superfamily protein [Arthrobacter sp. 9AX]